MQGGDALRRGWIARETGRRASTRAFPRRAWERGCSHCDRPGARYRTLFLLRHPQAVQSGYGVARKCARNVPERRRRAGVVRCRSRCNARNVSSWPPLPTAMPVATFAVSAATPNSLFLKAYRLCLLRRALSGALRFCRNRLPPLTVMRYANYWVPVPSARSTGRSTHGWGARSP